MRFTLVKTLMYQKKAQEKKCLTYLNFFAHLFFKEPVCREMSSRLLQCFMSVEEEKAKAK